MLKTHLFGIIAVIMTMALCHGIVTAYDVSNYCGVPPYPTPLNDLPLLPSHKDLPNPRLTYFHTFVRHGDRSTIINDCFPGLPELTKRVWEQCPDTTSAGSNSMTTRERLPGRYDLNARPLEGSQILNGNCHSGQLSRHGSLMSYNNGLRVGRYLNATFRQSNAFFRPESLKLRSTDYHRTRETATSFITGLLDNMPYDSKMMEKVMPIEWIDAASDGLKINTHLCRAQPYLDEVYASPEWVEYTETEWEPLRDLVGSVINEEKPVLGDVFDCAKTYFCHGYEMPDGYLDLVDKRVEAAMTKYWAYAFQYDHTRSSKLFSGILTIDILNAFAIASAGGKHAEPFFSLYSGHDFGPMMNIISLLQIDHLIWPPYSAMLNVEMYGVDNDEQSYMRFIYNEIVYVPLFCTDDAIGELCPTRVVLEYLQQFVPTADDCPNYPRAFDLSTLAQAIANAKDQQTKGTYTGVDITVLQSTYDKIEAYNNDLIQHHQQQRLYGQPKKISHVERWFLE